METSKQIFEKEKRIQKSKDVIVRLSSSTTTGFNFNVYTDEIKERLRYIGTINESDTDDSCTCQSFMHGNSENYQRDNPLPFTCKHIIKAHSMMEGYW